MSLQDGTQAAIRLKVGSQVAFIALLATCLTSLISAVGIGCVVRKLVLQYSQKDFLIFEQRILNKLSGAFEFYLFHFCYLLVNPQWQNRPFNWNNMSDIVYPCLLDNYLRHFLPLNKKSLPKFPQTRLSPIRSPMVQHSPHSRLV